MFKSVFSRKEVTIDFLRHYLPDDVRDLLVPEVLTERIQALDDVPTLKRLHRQALQVDSLEAFEALMPT
jgi:hypothetical protein